MAVSFIGGGKQVNDNVCIQSTAMIRKKITLKPKLTYRSVGPIIIEIY
jgi:hypothetical protein